MCSSLMAVGNSSVMAAKKNLSKVSSEKISDHSNANLNKCTRLLGGGFKYPF